MAQRKQRNDGETELVPNATLCLAFANTAAPGRDTPPEPLATYADLVAWGQRAGVLGTLDARRLRAAAEKRPDEAADVVARAFKLRSAIARAFLAAGERKQPAAADVETLNEALARALPARCIVPGPRPEDLLWDWAGGEDDLERVLWPVAHAAGELLASAERRWIGRCAAEDCRRFFFNSRHAPTRRWCAQETCGNRGRSRRFRRREKARGS